MLEKAYGEAGKRKKRAIRSIQLRALSWGDMQDDAFFDLRDCLRNSVKTAYPNPKKIICIHTDASDQFWAGVVTQTDEKNLKLATEEQCHEPLAFLGVAFKDAERNWSTHEKEGYAIFQVFQKLEYMLLGNQKVHALTDHRNLLFVFAPRTFDSHMGRHVVSKVQRWAIFLSQFDFSIEHLEGSRNICVDMLTRWARGYRNDKVETSQVSALVRDTRQLFPGVDEITWPNIESLKKSQHGPSTIN